MNDRERIFREHQPSREWLEQTLNHPLFKEATEILREKRTRHETLLEVNSMANDGMISTRLNSQRIGMEGVFIDLVELTTPPPPERQEIPADHNEPEAYQKLNE